MRRLPTALIGSGCLVYIDVGVAFQRGLLTKGLYPISKFYKIYCVCQVIEFSKKKAYDQIQLNNDIS